MTSTCETWRANPFIQSQALVSTLSSSAASPPFLLSFSVGSGGAARAWTARPTPGAACGPGHESAASGHRGHGNPSSHQAIRLGVNQAVSQPSSVRWRLCYHHPLGALECSVGCWAGMVVAGCSRSYSLIRDAHYQWRFSPLQSQGEHMN
jgi:hypothetical protein